MPSYKYEGAYAGGEKVSGVVEAVSRAEAISQIRQNCDVVLSLKEVPKVAVKSTPFGTRTINAKSLSLVCKQFSIILKAGLPLVQATGLVAEQCPDKNLSALLQQVAQDVSDGWSLSRSFQQRGEKSLPVTFRETLRAGEESGDVQMAFERMASYFERMNKTRESVVSALTYPAFIMVAAVIAVMVVMNTAVPALLGLFESMEMELPLPTVILIAVSNFFRKYTLHMVALIAMAVMGIYLYGNTAKGGWVLARIQLRIPVVGGIIRMSNASQFAHTMSALLAAGMPILQAIEASGRTMTNRCLSQEILDTLSGVEGGHSFGECLRYAKELPGMLVQMAAVGETTGSMETTLQVLAEYYDNETEVKTKRAVALLEPMIIVVLSVFVVILLLAIYLPMFQMYGGI